MSREIAYDKLKRLPGILPKYSEYLLAIRCAPEASLPAVVEFLDAFETVVKTYTKIALAYPVGHLERNKDSVEAVNAARAFKKMQEAWKKRPKLSYKRYGKTIIV